ncbi:MAG: hypothetical protein PHE49_11235, partial [bacterium]|nr:hypothetical protein [bacterium]
SGYQWADYSSKGGQAGYQKISNKHKEQIFSHKDAKHYKKIWQKHCQTGMSDLPLQINQKKRCLPAVGRDSASSAE